MSSARLCGAAAAKTAADFTVVDTVPTTQTIYVPPGHLAASNPFLLEAERIVRDAGDESLTAQASRARAGRLGTNAASAP